MWKKWMAACLAVLMLAGAASAEEGAASHVSADGWTAGEKDGVIAVIDEKGKEIARIEHQAEDGVTSVLVAEDYNFDGKADLAALTSMGTANTYYAVWLRTADGGFVEYPAFREICAPRCNPLMESIEAFERVSAAEYVETEYRWLEGELKAVWKRNIRYLDADGINVKVTESVPGEEERVAHEWNMTAEQWGSVMKMMNHAEVYAFILCRENAGEVLVTYEGTERLDGELLYAYSIEAAGEQKGILYLDEKQPQSALWDDDADGTVNPKWQVTVEGEQTERNL